MVFGLEGKLVSRGAQRLLPIRKLQVGLDHHPNQFAETDTGFPSELLLRFGRVSQEQVDLGRSQIARVVLDEILPIEADLRKGRRTLTRNRPPRMANLSGRA